MVGVKSYFPHTPLYPRDMVGSFNAQVSGYHSKFIINIQPPFPQGHIMINCQLLKVIDFYIRTVEFCAWIPRLILWIADRIFYEIHAIIKHVCVETYLRATLIVCMNFVSNPSNSWSSSNASMSPGKWCWTASLLLPFLTTLFLRQRAKCYIICMVNPQFLKCPVSFWGQHYSKITTDQFHSGPWKHTKNA